MLPTLPYGIDRPRLIDKVKSTLNHKVTLINAPPGYGKTTLAAQFMQTTNHPVAWHTLHDDERDVANLYVNALNTLETICPGIKDALPAPYGHSPRELATFVTNHLKTSELSDFIYVIDDLHLASSLSATNWLDVLVERLPPGGRLIMISRNVPRLSFETLLTRGEIATIEQDDLRMTTSEVEEVARMRGINLTPEIMALVQSVDGWPAGVALALQPLSESLDALLGEENKPQILFERLAKLALERQSPEMRDFLLTSSTLEIMTPEGCINLGLHNVSNQLDAIYHNSMFASKSSGGFSYHSLYRAFLQNHLKQTSHDRYTELHAKAASWYEEYDENDRAFYHYIESGQIDQAASIAERVALPYYFQGREDTLLDWENQLQGFDVNVPHLIYECAAILIDRSQYDEALQNLDRIDKIGQKTANRTEIVALANVLRALIKIRQGDYDDAITLVTPLMNSSSDMVRGRALRISGFVKITLGHLNEGISELEEAVKLMRNADHISIYSHLLQDLQIGYTRMGRLADAGTCLQELVALRRKMGGGTALALALNNLGYHYYQMGNYAQAQSTLREGISIAVHTNNPRVECYLYWSLGEVISDLGGFDEADQLFIQALALIDAKNDSNLFASILTGVAILRQREGKIDESITNVTDALELSQNAPYEQLNANRALWAARIEKGELDDALHQIQLMIKKLREQEAHFTLVSILGMYTYVNLLRADFHAAERAWKLALDETNLIGSTQPLVTEIAFTPQLENFVSDRDPNSPLLQDLKQLRTAQKNYAQHKPRAALRSHSPALSLQVFTLGQESIKRNGVLIPESHWQAAMARELFFFLLFNSRNRAEIGLTFWPDGHPDSMWGSFYTTMHRARNAVGKDMILYLDGRYCINPSVIVWCDAFEIEKLVKEARLLPYHDVRAEDLWRKAVNLYQGDFLPTIDRHWTIPHREAAQELYREALVGMGFCARERNDFDEAIKRFNQASAVDPYREDIHQAIMQIYVLVGARAKAIEHYERLKQVLYDELGVTPSEETIQFVKTLFE
jgi:LuxR family maltose regulon positive regulatory protein